MGSEFTFADLCVFYGYGLAGSLSKAVAGVDLLDGQPEMAELIGRLAERPSVAKVTAEAKPKR